MARGTRDGAFLDRPMARLCAIAVFVLCGAALVYIHRNELWPGPKVEASGADPIALCMRDRLAVIDGQLRDGVLKPEQADLFRTRVDALCQAQNRRSGPEGLPPGMAPPPLPTR
ncbi:MAG TPA: hypothetical protein VF930_03145 [Stellaceae bacterium]